MKKKISNFILLSMLCVLIALSNCSRNPENTGNGANGPPEAPNAEYPGNNSDSTSTSSHADSIHQQ